MKIKKISYTAIMIAIGVLLPQVFHLIGGSASGGTFLPMHIPVLLSGMLLGPLSGTLTGIICPVLSFLITGMPPVAKLPFMVFELLAYGFISGIASKKLKLNCYISLIISMIGGRIVNAFALWVSMLLFNMNVSPLMAVWSALLNGITGLIIQLVFIPLLYKLLSRMVNINDRN